MTTPDRTAELTTDVASDAITTSTDSNGKATLRAVVSAGRLARVSPSGSSLHIALAVALYAAAAAVGLWADNVWVWMLCWFVMAWVLVGNVAIMHATTHNHLFRSPRTNRLVGTIASAAVFVSFSTYRALHFEHHLHTAEPGNDPELTPEIHLESRLQYFALMPLFGFGLLANVAWFTGLTAIGRTPAWVRTGAQRRAIRANACVLVATVAIAVTALFVAPGLVFALWLAPVAIALVFLAPALVLPDHYGLDGLATGEGPLTDNCGTVHSNALVRWLFWNTNYHLAHHLVPAVPGDKLPAVQQVIDNELVPAWTAKSYTAFHRDLLASIPTRAKKRSTEATHSTDSPGPNEIIEPE